MMKYPEAAFPEGSNHTFLDFIFYNAGYQKLRFDSRRSDRRHTFRWSDGSEQYLKTLKSEFGLDQVTRRCKTDYEIALALCRWVSMRWAHHGYNESKRPDALSILRAARHGKQFRCVEYSIVLQACLAAYGIKARIVGLLTIDIETIRGGGGHVVVEAYIKSHGKWVMLDPQNGVVPVLGRTPLNSVELQKAISMKDRRLSFAGRPAARYIKFIFPYLFYFQTRFDNRANKMRRQRHYKRTTALVLVPLGYKKPLKFQRGPESKYLVRIETHSIRDFYPKV
ncbi:MAG: transglutaminase domain-containing protein [Candidatus Micrarchaeota archaeon]|nr:transglutaminase domain-containing protein [Candidatus Micrarchaeota archaeon]